MDSSRLDEEAGQLRGSRPRWCPWLLAGRNKQDTESGIRRAEVGRLEGEGHWRAGLAEKEGAAPQVSGWTNIMARQGNGWLLYYIIVPCFVALGLQHPQSTLDRPLDWYGVARDR